MEKQWTIFHLNFFSSNFRIRSSNWPPFSGKHKLRLFWIMFIAFRLWLLDIELIHLTKVCLRPVLFLYVSRYKMKKSICDKCVEVSIHIFSCESFFFIRWLQRDPEMAFETDTLANDFSLSNTLLINYLSLRQVQNFINAAIERDNSFTGTKYARGIFFLTHIETCHG